MYLASPVLLNHRTVERGGITLVQIKPIHGVFFVKAHHQAITQDFRDDGCGRDQGNFLVSFDNGFLRDTAGQRQAAIQKCVGARRSSAARSLSPQNG